MSGITVDEITERADVGRGSFYYHFGAMDKLVQEIVGDILDELIEQMETACHGKERLEDVLSALLMVHIEYFDKRWRDFVLYFQGRAELTLEQSYDGLETPFIGYLETMERLVDAALAEPLAKPRLRRLGCAVAGFISGYYSFASVAPVGEDVDVELAPMRNTFVTSLARFARTEADGTSPEAEGEKK